MHAPSLPFLAVLASTAAAAAQSPRLLHSFERQQLTDRYLSEGVNAADINGDGHMDVIYGPLWFAGPDWKKAHVIFPPLPQNRDGYTLTVRCSRNGTAARFPHE